MQIIDTLRQRITRLLSAPGDELGSWARFCRFQIQLWRSCARRLHENNSMAMSSALSFRTILVLVPALFLLVLILQSTGLSATGKDAVRGVLDGAGLGRIIVPERILPATAPTTGASQPARETATDMAMELVDVVGGQVGVAAIGPIGVVLLIYTVTTLLTTVERSLNRVFGAPRTRSFGRRVLMYWAAISLAPLALIAVNVLAILITDVFQTVPVLSWFTTAVFGWAGPIIGGVVILAAFYKFVPNTTVSFRAAVAGAVIAVPLLMLAKYCMMWYVALVQESFFGNLIVIPLFLIAVNIMWWVFLFGAELAHTGVNLQRLTTAAEAEKAMLGPWHLLAAALATARAYARKQGPADLEAISREIGLPAEAVAKLMEHLTEAGIVCPVTGRKQDKYMPGRPLGAISVADVLDVAAPGVGAHCPPLDDEYLTTAVGHLHRQAAGIVMHLKLDEVLSQIETAESTRTAEPDEGSSV